MSAQGQLCSAPFPKPPATATELRFEDVSQLATVRAFASEQGARAGLPADRLADLALAVSELATNSLEHGGGEGVIRLWTDDASVVCEVSDRGQMPNPPPGHQPPDPHAARGRGLWLVHQVSDVVQQRCPAAGLVTRVAFLRS